MLDNITLNDIITESLPSLRKELSFNNVYVGQKCSYCNYVLTKDTITKDHVIPQNSGLKILLNLVPSCKRCNNIKSDQDLLTFLGLINLNNSKNKPKDKPQETIRSKKISDICGLRVLQHSPKHGLSQYLFIKNGQTVKCCNSYNQAKCFAEGYVLGLTS